MLEDNNCNLKDRLDEALQQIQVMQQEKLDSEVKWDALFWQ